MLFMATIVIWLMQVYSLAASEVFDVLASFTLLCMHQIGPSVSDKQHLPQGWMTLHKTLLLPLAIYSATTPGAP